VKNKLHYAYGTTIFYWVAAICGSFLAVTFYFGIQE
jgi:hypothetical protein